MILPFRKLTSPLPRAAMIRTGRTLPLDHAFSRIMIAQAPGQVSDVGIQNVHGRIVSFVDAWIDTTLPECIQILGIIRCYYDNVEALIGLFGAERPWSSYGME